jgi:hypothetical protein
MHRLHCTIPFALFLFALLTTQVAADSPANFPLRVHIYQRVEHTHYFHGALDWVDGDGRANLFENGQPRGFDFDFHCGDRILTSVGYETYPARWKKQDRTLELLYPVPGKPGATRSCELKVTMKEDTVYVHRQGSLDTEPASIMRDWMQRHQYDPEHGKDEPVNSTARAPYGSEPPSPVAQPAPATQPAPASPPQ